MTELIIKNGFVFDPLNGINGEKMDICIKDGKIVKTVNERRAKKIDATGLTVMPGGVDIHTHVAGGEVNTGRMVRPEDHVKDVVAKTAADTFRHRLLNSVNIRYGLPLLTNGLHYNHESIHGSARSQTHSRRTKRHTTSGQSNLPAHRRLVVRPRIPPERRLRRMRKTRRMDDGHNQRLRDKNR